MQRYYKLDVFDGLGLGLLSLLNLIKSDMLRSIQRVPSAELIALGRINEKPWFLPSQFVPGSFPLLRDTETPWGPSLGSITAKSIASPATRYVDDRLLSSAVVLRDISLI